MVDSSVIFIDSPQKNYGGGRCKDIFYVQPQELPFRICSSLVPPLTKKFQKVYIDLLGPLIAFLILTALVNYGYSLKNIKYSFSPNEALVAYIVVTPVIFFLLCKIGQSAVSFIKVFALVGYGLYGHVFTLLLSFLCFQEKSNTFFFICLVIFSGLSTLRMALVILGTLKVPAARLLVCSTISVINVLFIIFLHFAYMHRNFEYKKKL